jgi:uncharacterized protein YtpQ (UPF0354 family)
MLEAEGWTVERLHEVASFNIRSLDVDLKKDSVYGNDFYFQSTQDGYDASRILNGLLMNVKENLPSVFLTKMSSFSLISRIQKGMIFLHKWP